MPSQEGGAEPPRTGERESPDRPDERADPDRRIEVADAAVTEVEELRCAVTTMKTWTAPKTAVWAVSRTIITRRARFRLPSVVKPARRSAAIVDASSSRRGVSARSTLMRTEKNVDTTTSTAVSVNTSPVLATAKQHPGECRPGEDRDALDAARDRVRCGELVRCSSERGRQCRLRRAERCVRDRRARSESAYTSHGSASSEHAHAAAATSTIRVRFVIEQDALARIAVAEHPGERSDERRRERVAARKISPTAFSPPMPYA